ncbi:MAG: trehalase-like domain-containing protein [Acidimicrobiia bacterium]
MASIKRRYTKGVIIKPFPPINDCSLLSDNRTIAIVEPDASISWLCFPRVDSAAVFAHLLDTENDPERAGIFSIEDAQGSFPRQNYVDDTMILESHFETFTITDYLDTSRGRTKHQAGRSDLVRVVEGTGVINVLFAPRLNFGRSPTRLVQKDRGLVIKGGIDLTCLRSPDITWTIVSDDLHDSASATIDLDAMGGRVKFELRCGTANVRSDSLSEAERREGTRVYWQKWVDKLQLPSSNQEEVRRSAVLLKSLCHTPTGAILAAATTSLPEGIGGQRNWDYRYCWLRDASMTAATLVNLGSHSEAMKFLDWLDDIVKARGNAAMLNPLYMVSGSHLAPEGSIDELSGYRSSRPVRVNNGADAQIQLDVFGAIVDLISTLADKGEPLATKHWNLVCELVEAVKLRWQEEDAGIWEFRSAPRQYTNSKLMCWVAVDRAVKLSDYFTGEIDQSWVELRDEIAEAICENSYKAHRNAFTSAYDGDDIDASVLALGIFGFCEPDDPKFLGTIKAVEDALLINNTVFRYLVEDALPGTEGGWHLLTLWLCECYFKAGRKQDAINLFEIVRKNIGATGLMSEQVDPETGEAMGNLPQAYSHLGFIDAVLTLSK